MIYLIGTLLLILTATTESRAATARMSAQETVPGHTASTFALMLSMTPKPLMDPTLGNAVCSPVKVAVSFSNTDASQPCENTRGVIFHFITFIFCFFYMEYIHQN
jgi:hypothetical protein